jgi:CheY-like chemotaxis protein
MRRYIGQKAWGGTAWQQQTISTKHFIHSHATFSQIGILQMSNLAFVIEDNKDISDLFSRALISAGFQVEPIFDGAIAQSRLEEESPSLVVLDMHMPNVNGAILFSQIRAGGHLKETKVIIATADAMMGECHKDQADLLLQKPVTFSQMRDFAMRLRRK